MKRTLRISKRRLDAVEPRQDHHGVPPRWRSATVAVGCVCIGLCVSALCLIWSMQVLPRLFDRSDVWFNPADIWDTVPAARFVANGAVLFIYESGGDPPYTYGPLWAVILAPALFVGDHLELVYGKRYQIPRSTMIIPVVLVGATAAISILSAAMWRVTSHYAVTVRSKAVIASAIPAFVATGAWYHGEDVLVAAFVLLAAAAGGPTVAALWTAAALLTKQTAMAYAPALLAACRAGSRGRFVFVAAGLPTAVMALLFAAAPSSLISSVRGRSPCAECFVPSLWTSFVWESDEMISAAPSRILWIAASAAAAYFWRQRCSDLQGVVALLAAVGLMRCLLFEPGIYAYYWFPPMAMAVAGASLSGRRLWPLLCGFAALTAWHAAYAYVPLAMWWLAIAGTVVLLWGPQMRTLGPPLLSSNSPTQTVPIDR